MRFVVDTQQASKAETAIFVVLAVAFHCVAVWVLSVLPQKKVEMSSGATASQATVRVSVLNKKSDIPLGIKRAEPQVHKTKTKGIVVSQTAPRIPVELHSEELNAVPKADENSVPSSAAAPMSRFLPQSNTAFLERQQRIGAASGDVLANEDVLPETQGEEVSERPNVVTTEFSTLAYRLELERRFADAWGGTRMLPPYSRFSGRVGEIIVYNVLINRDGSLLRVVNLSALEQSDRDFSAVDLLVRDFADSVFPLNPIPERIRITPMSVKWSIRFMGYQYSFF